VALDALDEKITAHFALSRHGVVLTDDLAVDNAATAARRAAMRAERGASHA
jgi:hypothetical protein